MSVEEEILDNVIIIENLNEKNEKSLKEHRKNVSKQQIFRGHRLKPKFVFTFVMYIILILTFMIVPLMITLLITEFGG
ncbi:MAG: hypothetical protein KAT66_05105 [Candidatus Lokiarchaeota archaeon]|nr:hypothetical protein [Candidatus Lokiarchaeota archaeon]